VTAIRTLVETTVLLGSYVRCGLHKQSLSFSLEGSIKFALGNDLNIFLNYKAPSSHQFFAINQDPNLVLFLASI
jgi:hypothetical protein